MLNEKFEQSKLHPTSSNSVQRHLTTNMFDFAVQTGQLMLCPTTFDNVRLTCLIRLNEPTYLLVSGQTQSLLRRIAGVAGHQFLS